MANALRPSNPLKNKTNVNAVGNRYQEATAEDFVELGQILDDHATKLDAVTGAPDQNPNYGVFTTLGLLSATHPTAVAGAYAIIDPGTGSDPQIALWDDTDDEWVLQENIPAHAISTDPDNSLSLGTDNRPYFKERTAEEIATAYESNEDTNKYTDAEKALVGNTSGVNTGDQNLSGLEPALGSPDTDGKVLSSTALGERTWIDPPSGAVEIVTNETPTAVLKFDKNYFPDETRQLNLSSGDLTLSLDAGVTNVVGNTNFFDVVADGAHVINLGAGFKANGAIPKSLSGSILPSGTYTFFCIYSTDGVIINVPNFDGQQPVDEDDDVENVGLNAFLLYAEDLSTPDGDEVLLWLDRSTEGKPATAVTGKAPIASTVGEFKSVKFDGSTSIMSVADVDGLGGTDVEASFFIVAQFDVTAPQGTLISLNDAVASNSKNICPLMFRASPSELVCHAPDNTTFYTYAATYELGMHVYIINKKGTTLDIYMDGALILENYSVSGIDTGNKFTIGALIKQLNPDGKYFFKGDVLAAGAYYKKLTPTELGIISESLTTKYGIELRTTYEPLFTSSTDLSIAYEAGNIRGLEDLDALTNVYPVNKGLSYNRDTFKINFGVSGVIYDENEGHPAMSFPGTQSKIITSQTILANGGIDRPMCVFFVAQYTVNGLLQVPVGLILGNSPNNNLLWAGRSATDDAYAYRRVTTTKTLTSIFPVDNSRHIFCYNIKTGGLLDVWIDNVKVATDLDLSTSPNVLASNQILALGNNQNNTAPFTGLLELVHAYDAEKSDTYIGDNFDSINAALEVYV